MDFSFSAEQELYRQEVRAALACEAVRAQIAKVWADPDPEPDTRPLYRELGRRGLLVPNWPVEYGGGGRDLIDAAIVHEELVRAGVPDTNYVNTILIVGLFILMVGTPEQKARHLPAIARGQRFASVLYTEPDSGSDLGSLSTVAQRDSAGDWRICGVKVFSLKSDLTDIGLCAARTGAADSRYGGISLFLVDLHAQGMRRTPIASIANEQFHRLDLDGVRVPAGDLLGEENNGWPLITQCLVVERTGMDYSLKAEHWLAAAGEVLTARKDVDDAVLEEIGRHGAAVEASRLMAWQVLSGLAKDRVDEANAAAAKLYCSELAQRISAWSAVRLAGAGADPRVPLAANRMLEAAFREAPGVTMAGGTSNMMLQIVANLALDALDWEARTP